jgi:hypothetical protein
LLRFGDEAVGQEKLKRRASGTIDRRGADYAVANKHGAGVSCCRGAETKVGAKGWRVEGGRSARVVGRGKGFGFIGDGSVVAEV